MKQRIYELKPINNFNDFIQYIYIIHNIKYKVIDTNIPEYEYN